MDSLDKAIKKLNNLKSQVSSLPQLPEVPAIKAPPVPSMTATNTQKLPGVAPNSNKDPKKVADQLKAGQPQKPKIKDVLKTDSNGQWSLEKAVKGIHVDPSGFEHFDTGSEENPTTNFAGHIHVNGLKVPAGGNDRMMSGYDEDGKFAAGCSHEHHLTHLIANQFGLPPHVANGHYLDQVHEQLYRKKPFTILPGKDSLSIVED